MAELSFGHHCKLNTEGFNLTVFPAADRKGWFRERRVTHRATGVSQRGRRCYASEREAKKAALDALLWVRQHLKTNGGLNLSRQDRIFAVSGPYESKFTPKRFTLSFFMG